MWMGAQLRIIAFAVLTFLGVPGSQDRLDHAREETTLPKDAKRTIEAPEVHCKGNPEKLLANQGEVKGTRLRKGTNGVKFAFFPIFALPGIYSTWEEQIFVENPQNFAKT